MYTNKKLEVIQDEASYTDSDGTKYPVNFPKDGISELFKVTLTDRPEDNETHKTTGFYINTENTQVWNTRLKTQEELNADIDLHNAEIDYELGLADVQIMRSFLASFDGDEIATARVTKHKLDQAAKRLTKREYI